MLRLVAVALLAPLVACGAREVPRFQPPPPSDRYTPVRTETPTVPSALTNRVTVLFDKPWLVVEGVWEIASRDATFAGDPAFRGQRNGLLGAALPHSMWVMVPPLYGKHPVRIEASAKPIPVPGRCEDQVEVSYRQQGSDLWMYSFETNTKMSLPPGDYRVRLCVNELDETNRLRDREFVGNRYRVFPATYVFQFWPAKAAPDAVIEVGSKAAANLHESGRFDG